ncbi:MAG: hypothetical protein WD751_09190 [Anaerolineales bacterium]
MTRLASLAIAAAGVIHLIIAPEHYAHSPAHGILFAMAGVTEIAWALAFLRWPTERMYYVGISIAGALIALWALTRFIPMPFEHEIGEVDLAGVLCKLSELIGLGALLILASQGRIAGLARRTFVGFMGEAIILGAFFGIGAYMVAHEVEPYLPFLGGEIHSEEGEEQLLP